MDSGLRSALAPGAVVASRYRIDALLGQGGTASVFRAHDLERDAPVALKVFAGKQMAPSRRLEHPNVIKLLELGENYLTMELLTGMDLGTRLEKSGPLPIAEGLRVLAQACAGLQHAHEQGVVHRDVKPDNLFVTDTGVVKLMDFGIAKGEHGTPEYMSPEQITGSSPASPLTDIYAMGCTAFATFTGEPPFVSAEVMGVLTQQANNQPPALTVGPPALVQLVARLLEKDPAKRPQSCSEVRTELERIRVNP